MSESNKINKADAKTLATKVEVQLSDADQVKLLTDQLNKERTQRIKDIKYLASTMRVCTMGIESISRSINDPNLLENLKAIHGAIFTMRHMLEQEVSQEAPKVNIPPNIDGKEAIH